MKTQANDSERSSKSSPEEAGMLKACPHCGGKAQRLEGEGLWCQIGCTGCSAKGGEYPNDWPRAEANWNRRTLPHVGEGEAVAWRYRVRGEEKWTVVNTDPMLSRVASWRWPREIEPLFLHPPRTEIAGWRLVPEKPTPEMIALGREAHRHETDAGAGTQKIEAAYRIMLAAAPVPEGE
jgi:ribosomal protein L37AE/L43A